MGALGQEWSGRDFNPGTFDCPDEARREPTGAKHRRDERRDAAPVRHAELLQHFPNARPAELDAALEALEAEERVDYLPDLATHVAAIRRGGR